MWRPLTEGWEMNAKPMFQEMWRDTEPAITKAWLAATSNIRPGLTLLYKEFEVEWDKYEPAVKVRKLHPTPCTLHPELYRLEVYMSTACTLPSTSYSYTVEALWTPWALNPPTSTGLHGGGPGRDQLHDSTVCGGARGRNQLHGRGPQSPHGGVNARSEGGGREAVYY
mmetsp:Transcript_24005/g.75168  ORF Transcript_24005/g.75168 Transcript_24005/m.75168 type:complete len:168 (-) Transcript_24005:46-549(-)